MGIRIALRGLLNGNNKEKFLKIMTACREDFAEVKRKKAPYMYICKSFSTARLIHE